MMIFFMVICDFNNEAKMALVSLIEYVNVFVLISSVVVIVVL